MTDTSDKHIPHEKECRSKSGYACTCSSDRQEWRLCEAKVRELEQALERSRFDRNAWTQCESRNRIMEKALENIRDFSMYYAPTVARAALAEAAFLVTDKAVKNG